MSVEFIIFLAFSVFIGACIGSFINVVVYRLPKMMEHQWLMDCLNFLREYLNDRNIERDSPDTPSTTPKENEVNNTAESDEVTEFTSPSEINKEATSSDNVNASIASAMSMDANNALNLVDKQSQDIGLLINKIEDSQLEENSKEPFNLSFPRSHCPNCKKAIPIYRNIPLFTWLIQTGKSNCCKQSISPRYFFVELLAALLTLFVFLHFNITVKGFFAAGFMLTLLALAAIDYETRLLPDSITLPLMWVGIIINLYDVFVPITESIFGAVIGYLVLWTLYQSHKLLTKREGMGYGDFKLTAVFGAWLGYKSIPIILFIAAIVGIIVALKSLRVRNNPTAEVISFGPSLCFAAAITMFYSEQLIAFLGF